jgi:hypothetical protein
MKSLWRLSSQSSVFFNLNYYQRNYVNNALPEDKVRKDEELDASLKYAYSLWPKFSIYGLGEYVVNTSTLGEGDVRNKNYNSLILSLGLNWDVF